MVASSPAGSPEPAAQSAPGAVQQGQDSPLLVVRDLVKHFPIRGGLLYRTRGYIRAVDGISFTIRRGETFGLVGESGCGKTTTGRL
ncbi:MAG: dipeptide/oligopeptide/nickel ABC transporter ATP-binding protein, partial [Chloroflexota bacterium]